MSVAPSSSRYRLFVITLLAVLGLLIWDASGLDLVLARVVGSAAGFAWREDWFLTRVLHDGARWVAWALAAGLILAIWWPVGALRRIDQRARLQLVLSVLLVSLFVSTLKRLSLTTCPWDLALFGGWVPYVSHWSSVPDGGPGHCFPAGHASTGFAFIGGYFVFRQVEPQAGQRWLRTSIAMGVLLGLAQQARGAHFMSHTLWSGFLCWSGAWAVDEVWRWWRHARRGGGAIVGQERVKAGGRVSGHEAG